MPLQIAATGGSAQIPTLPDKASFPDLSGVYLNSAATHPRSAGATALVKKALLAEAGDASGIRC